MSVRENLIKAKALIDTPEKWAKIGRSQSAAIYLATSNFDDFHEASEAYASIRLRGIGYDNVIATFDRAIEASE
jgi:hypothetical protein